MDLRRLPAPGSERRFGRRASDAAVSIQFYAATFVAQVAGLSIPNKARAGAYGTTPAQTPAGIVADLKA